METSYICCYHVPARRQKGSKRGDEPGKEREHTSWDARSSDCSLPCEALAGASLVLGLRGAVPSTAAAWHIAMDTMNSHDLSTRPPLSDRQNTPERS